MIDVRTRNELIQAGYEVGWARRERVQYHGRTYEEARELQYQAARSASCCGECFRPLSPTDSVTMQWRNVRSARYPRWLRLPICLFCTLDDIARPFSEHHYRRTCCLNCGRPLRLPLPQSHTRWLNTFDIRLPWILSLTTRSCCTDCEHQAKLKRNAERRRVQHEPRICINCGRSFTPKRADAVTCSNRCRQRVYRSRKPAAAPARGEKRARRRRRTSRPS